MVQTTDTSVAKKGKRKRSATQGKRRQHGIKRHSPEDNSNKTSAAYSSSAEYDKVARTTLAIRSQILQRQLQHNASLTPDTGTDRVQETFAGETPFKFERTPGSTLHSPAKVIDLVSSSGSECTSRSRSVSLTPDAGTATPIPIPDAVPVTYETYITTPISPPRRDHDDEHALSGSASDDAMADARPHSKYSHWSLKQLEEATDKIALVHSLTNHLIIMDCKNSTDRTLDKSSRGLTHVQRSRRILHGHCLSMLQGLYRSLNVLFHSIE